MDGPSPTIEHERKQLELDDAIDEIKLRKLLRQKRLLELDSQSHTKNASPQSTQTQRSSRAEPEVGVSAKSNSKDSFVDCSNDFSTKAEEEEKIIIRPPEEHETSTWTGTNEPLPALSEGILDTTGIRRLRDELLASASTKPRNSTKQVAQEHGSREDRGRRRSTIEVSTNETDCAGPAQTSNRPLNPRSRTTDTQKGRSVRRPRIQAKTPARQDVPSSELSPHPDSDPDYECSSSEESPPPRKRARTQRVTQSIAEELEELRADAAVCGGRATQNKPDERGKRARPAKGAYVEKLSLIAAEESKALLNLFCSHMLEGAVRLLLPLRAWPSQGDRTAVLTAVHSLRSKLQRGEFDEMGQFIAQAQAIAHIRHRKGAAGDGRIAAVMQALSQWQCDWDACLLDCEAKASYEERTQTVRDWGQKLSLV